MKGVDALELNFYVTIFAGVWIAKIEMEITFVEKLSAHVPWKNCFHAYRRKTITEKTIDIYF